MSVNIPSKIVSRIKFCPPLLLIPEKKSIYLRFSLVYKGKSESITPSLSQIYPFVSNRHSPLIELLDQDISKLLTVIRCSMIDIEDPDVELSAFLVKQSSGEKIPFECTILSFKKEQGLDVLLMELAMLTLQPDSYSLEIYPD